jgi:hypothetical protein
VAHPHKSKAGLGLPISHGARAADLLALGDIGFRVQGFTFKVDRLATKDPRRGCKVQHKTRLEPVLRICS